MAFSKTAEKVVSKSVALFIAIIVGAITLIGVVYFMPEVQSVIDSVSADGVDIAGWEILTTLGPIMLIFGAIIGLVVIIFMSVVDVAS